MVEAPTKKIRFSVADDVVVLREVAMYDRPFRHGSKAWREICANLTGRLQGTKERTVRERVVHLVELHLKGEKTSLKQ